MKCLVHIIAQHRVSYGRNGAQIPEDVLGNDAIFWIEKVREKGESLKLKAQR
jgi:hypothetical protein